MQIRTCMQSLHLNTVVMQFNSFQSLEPLKIEQIDIKLFTEIPQIQFPSTQSMVHNVRITENPTAIDGTQICTTEETPRIGGQQIERIG